jgi:hypothetical protein
MNTKIAEKPKTHEAPLAADEGKQLPSTQGASTSLAVVEIDEEDRGAGLKDIDPNERKIPFLRIIQTNSPEVEEGNPKFIAGAKPGMFFNTATKQVYKALIMIPCARDHKYIEYIPREAGSGFVGIRGPKDPLVLELRAKQGKFGKLSNGVTKRNVDGKALDGTEIVESFEIYGIFIDVETGAKFRAIASFSSTQISKYQGLIDRSDAFEYQLGDGTLVKPALYSHKWLCTTTVEKNKKGTFRGWVIGLFAKKEDGSDDVSIKSFVKKSDPLFVMAKEFAKFVEEGKAEVDYANAEPEAAAAAEVEM